MKKYYLVSSVILIICLVYAYIYLYKPLSNLQIGKEESENVTSQQNPTGKEPTYPTTDKAIQAVLAKKYNKQLSEVNVKVIKEVPGYAYGSVLFDQGGPGEGGMWIALLGNGWEVVWDGNGNVDCTVMRQQYGIPDTILKPTFCE